MAVMAYDPNGSDPVPASTHVAAPTPNGVLIDQRELCGMLRIRPRTLRRKVDAGVVPAPIRIGKKPLWLRTDIESWLSKEQTG
jgi:predicted DNA-binding transcriptional regulator AlpA